MPYREEPIDLLLERRSEVRAELAEIEERVRAVQREQRRTSLGSPMVITLIVVTLELIFGLVAAFVLCRPRLCGGSRIQEARTDAQSIRGAGEMYLAVNPTARCPCVHELIEERMLSASSRSRDPWDREFSIECNGEDVMVVSSGPDGRFGTEDDVQ